MLKLFISYSHKDEAHLQELDGHFSVMKSEGLVEVWHDQCFDLGDRVHDVISEKLEAADVVLFLVSSYFLDSNYCYKVEMPETLERAHQSSVRIVPVILRECDWLNAPFGGISAVPKYGKPIEDFSSRDKAYMEVVNVIKEEIAQKQAHPTLPSSNIAPDSATLVQQLRKQQSEKIKRRYGKIRLLNNELANFFYVPIAVLKPLPRVRLNSMSNHLSGLDMERDRLAMRKQEDRSPRLGLEFVNEHAKVRLFGKPGMGKSTFLQYLAIACCKGEFQGDRIPILIEFRREVSNDCDLVKLIQAKLQLESESQLQPLLRNGNFLLLLDGLDEVSESFRQGIQSSIQKFCDSYSSNRIILTCRTQTLRFPWSEFEDCEISDFSRAQQKQFIYKWFEKSTQSLKQGTVQAKACLDKLQQPENNRVAQLACTPVLLNLICSVFQRQQDIPQQRSTLYQTATELLLNLDETKDDGWNIRRESSSLICQNMSVGDMQNLLGNIAIYKFQQKNFVVFPQDEIQKKISEYLEVDSRTSLELLKSIESLYGLVIEQDTGCYLFSHLTFQEYFAAYKIHLDRNFEEILSSHIIDKHWYAIFLMVSEMLDDPCKFLWLTKESIDSLVAEDEKIQSLIMWISSKTNAAKESGATYRDVAIRSFYLSFYTWEFIDIIYALDSSLSSDLAWSSGEYSIDPDVEKERMDAIVADHEAEEHRAFCEDYDPYYVFESESNIEPEASSKVTDVTENLDSFIAIDYVTYDAFEEFLSDSNRDTENFIYYYYNRYSSYEDFCIHLGLTNNQEMMEHIQELESVMPNPFKLIISDEFKEEFKKSQAIFEKWWKANGQIWIDNFRDILIKARNIGHNWEFTADQKKVLQQYYDANKLLIDCLKLSKISPESRRSIENSLFLPLSSNKSAEK